MQWLRWDQLPIPWPQEAKTNQRCICSSHRWEKPYLRSSPLWWRRTKRWSPWWSTQPPPRTVHSCAWRSTCMPQIFQIFSDTKRWLELAITWNKLTPKTWKHGESSQVEAVAAQGKLRLLKSRAAFLSMDFKNLSWDFWAPAKLQELKHKELPN